MNSLIPEAMAQTAGGAQQASGMSMLVMMGLFVVIFYFLLIRPQQKKQKEHQAMLKQLAAEQKASGYRPPRLAVRGHATIVTDDGPREIDVVNLSQQGAGLVHDGELEVGTKLELVLWGGIRRRGIVRWSRQGQSGVWLTAPLEQADLESIRRFED